MADDTAQGIPLPDNDGWVANPNPPPPPPTPNLIGNSGWGANGQGTSIGNSGWGANDQGTPIGNSGWPGLKPGEDQYYKNNPLTVNAPDAGLRDAYTKAMIGNETTGASDFSSRYADTASDATGYDLSSTIARLAQHLPSREDAIDFPIGTAQDAGLHQVGSVIDTRSNMLDMWSKTGQSMGDLYQAAHNDPMIQDAVTAPYLPGETPPPFMYRLNRVLREEPIVATMGIPFSPLLMALGGVPNNDELASHPSVMDLAKSLGMNQSEQAASLVGGMIGSMSPRAYLKQNEDFMAGNMTPLQAIMFLSMHAIPGAGSEAMFPLAARMEMPPEGVTEGAAGVDRGAFLTNLKNLFDDTSGTRNIVTPVVKPPGGITGVGTSNAELQPIEDALNRVRGMNTSTQIGNLQATQVLPKEWAQPEFQERANTQIENRMKAFVDKDAPLLVVNKTGNRKWTVTGGEEDQTFKRLKDANEYVANNTVKAHMDDDVKEYLDTVKSMTDRHTELEREIADRLGKDPNAVMTVDKGAVPRRLDADFVMDEAAKFDPGVATRDVLGGSTASSIDRTGSKLQTMASEHRVWENTSNGETIPVDINKMVTVGTKRVDPVTGDTWRARPATIDEIEKTTGMKFSKNHMGNLVFSLNRLERIKNTMDFMDELKPALADKKMYIPRKEAEASGLPPIGMTQVSYPGINGYVHPKIGNILNDFYNKSNDLAWLTDRASRMLMQSLFITPVPHLANVAGQYSLNRSWDWIKPWRYGTMARSLIDAYHETVTMGPRYKQHLEEGSGLQYANTQTENYHYLVMHKALNEQIANPEVWGKYAQAFGLGLPELLRLEMKWSHQTVWKYNDVMLLGRQFELEARGMPIREAIYQSEKDIVNYRLNSNMLFTNPTLAHATSQALGSPSITMFGRYKSGIIRSLYNTVNDIVRPMKAGDRVEAIGKLTLLGLMTWGSVELQNAIGFRPSGAVAPLAHIWNAARADRDAGWETSSMENWATTAGTLLGLGPLFDVATQIYKNQNFFGSPVVNPRSSVPGQIGEFAEGASSDIPMAQLLVKSLKGDPWGAVGSLVNFGSKAPGPPPTSVAKEETSEAAAHERNNALLNWFDNLMGSPPPAAKVHTSGSSTGHNIPTSTHPGGAPHTPKQAPEPGLTMPPEPRQPRASRHERRSENLSSPADMVATPPAVG